MNVLRCHLFVTACLVSILAAENSALAHDIAAQMRAAATGLLKALTPELASQVRLPLDAERRTAWHYVPTASLEAQGGRRGVPIKHMSAQQRTFAVALLNSALSHRGQLQAATIMALETILKEIENGSPTRDSELYHVAIFGEPAADQTWGWSFEGHHLSVNLMLVDGTQFSITPSFWGSNPAIVPSGPFAGLDTLEAEQQLGRELARSLTPQQRASAVIADKAPRDVITGAQRKVERQSFLPPQGIPFEQLDAQQQQKLLELVRQFASKYRPEILAQIEQRTPIMRGEGMYFAWAGGMEPGEGHYYRVQTPSFLFEYDNTQNNANHVHTVWRAFDGDFGEDLLRHHYEHGHHHD
jgi:hypothetical protein